jgi:hypothetical protein
LTGRILGEEHSFLQHFYLAEISTFVEVARMEYGLSGTGLIEKFFYILDDLYIVLSYSGTIEMIEDIIVCNIPPFSFTT